MQRLSCNGDIVEDAEAGPGFPLFMMAAAGRAAGKAVLERQSRGEQCPRRRCARTAYHAFTHGKTDPPLDLLGNRAGEDLIDIGTIMSHRDQPGRSLLRLHEAVGCKPLLRKHLR